MKRIIFLCVFTATLFFILKTTMAQWVTETVDNPKYFSDFGPRSIAIDSNNHPHIAYGGDHLYYAYYDGSAWHYETIDSSPGVGMYTSLALDSAHNVHISYYDATNDDLKYVTGTSGSWSTPETIDSSGVVSMHTSLALDSAHNVHISYYDATNADLKYVTGTSGSWNPPETIDSSGDVGEYTSLALDSAHNVHISYYDDANHDLKYVTDSFGFWNTPETIDSSGGEYTSLALDSANNVHISYFDYTNHDLKYATSLDSDSDGICDRKDNCPNTQMAQLQVFVHKHSAVYIDTLLKSAQVIPSVQQDGVHVGRV